MFGGALCIIATIFAGSWALYMLCRTGQPVSLRSIWTTVDVYSGGKLILNKLEPEFAVYALQRKGSGRLFFVWVTRTQIGVEEGKPFPLHLDGPLEINFWAGTLQPFKEEVAEQVQAEYPPLQ